MPPTTLSAALLLVTAFGGFASAVFGAGEN
jgi:hypothetical protein